MEGDDEEEPKKVEAPAAEPAPVAATVEKVEDVEPAPASEDVVFCSKCGTKNAADASFCSKCGEKLA
ncbi:MAG: zinc-ribbon domain-containing protein [Atopobiaceae bacterium]|nr:zinc-ribbon domain-containing protein [Atopobiaceae bacterium]